MVLDFLLSLDLRCFTCGNSGPDLLGGGGGLIFRNGRKVQVVRYCWVRPTGDAISCQISGFVVETADIPSWSDLFVFLLSAGIVTSCKTSGPEVDVSTARLGCC